MLFYDKFLQNPYSLRFRIFSIPAERLPPVKPPRIRHAFPFSVPQRPAALPVIFPAVLLHAGLPALHFLIRLSSVRLVFLPRFLSGPAVRIRGGARVVRKCTSAPSGHVRTFPPSERTCLGARTQKNIRMPSSHPDISGPLAAAPEKFRFIPFRSWNRFLPLPRLPPRPQDSPPPSSPPQDPLPRAEETLPSRAVRTARTAAP